MAFLKEPGLYSAVRIHHGENAKLHIILLCVVCETSRRRYPADRPPQLNRNLNNI